MSRAWVTGSEPPSPITSATGAAGELKKAPARAVVHPHAIIAARRRRPTPARVLVAQACLARRETDEKSVLMLAKTICVATEAAGHDAPTTA